MAGAQLNRIASLEAEQLRLARLQWWNSLTPAQRRSERARIAQEQARLRWEHELKRYEAARREPLRRYRRSRASWVVLLGFGALIAGAIAGRHHGAAWGAFAAYLFVAAPLYLGPLRIRARALLPAGAEKEWSSVLPAVSSARSAGALRGSP